MDTSTGTSTGRRPATWGAAALWALTVVTCLAASRYSPSVVATPHGDRGDPLAVELGFLAVYLVVASVGAVVAAKRPRHVMGWLFLVCAALLGSSELAHGFAHHAVLTGTTATPAAGWAGLLGVVLFLPPFVLLLMYLPLVFPDGRLLSPRWAVVVVLLAANLVVLTLVELLRPGPLSAFPGIDNPLGVAGTGAVLDRAAAIADATFFPIVLAIGVAVVLRFRRATSVERQQFKWVALPAGVLLVFLPLNELTIGATTGPMRAVRDVVFFAAFAGIPIGLAIAVLRYRLYDIDRLVSRTVAYATLSLVMVGVYVVGVVSLGAAVRVLTGETSSDLVVAASTLAVAAAFQPARRGIQRGVDRRFDRARYDANRTVEGFGQRLRDELDQGALLREVREVVGTTIQPSTTTIWLTPRPAPIDGAASSARSRTAEPRGS